MGRELVLGAGIGTPGPLDLRLGTTLNVLNPPSWSHFGVRDAVERVLGLPVILDNDATAAALGERWRGAGRRADSFVYLYLGAGFGAGLVLGGGAHHGRRGNAAELSHIQVDPAGPPCDCGSRGCLALYVNPDGLLREARRAALEAPPSRPLAAVPDDRRGARRARGPAPAGGRRAGRRAPRPRGRGLLPARRSRADRARRAAR